MENFDVIVLTVAHNEFLDVDWNTLLKPNGILYGHVSGFLDLGFY